MIETDYHIGRVLQFLKRSGLEANTMVIFSSDNGPERSWIQRIEEFGHDSSHVYRGGKRDIYEGGHRVPFFIRWPNGIKQPGRSWHGVVGQVDLLATIADVVDVPLPENAAEDSQSFHSVLTDANAQYQRAPLINHSSRGRFAVTDGYWKLVLPHGKSTIELYNLSADPAEEHNVAAMHSELVVDLQKKATNIVLNGRTTPGAHQANDTGYWSDLTWIKKIDYLRQHNETE
jgi:arylsulfatase A